jgi:hypothetical protein
MHGQVRYVTQTVALVCQVWVLLANVHLAVLTMQRVIMVHPLCSAAFLNGAYFVNASSLFQLSAILEKRSVGAGANGELTTVRDA